MSIQPNVQLISVPSGMAYSWDHIFGKACGSPVHPDGRGSKSLSAGSWLERRAPQNPSKSHGFCMSFSAIFPIKIHGMLIVFAREYLEGSPHGEVAIGTGVSSPTPPDI